MTSEGYIRQLESAVRAVTIRSLTDYSWFGASAPRLPRHIERAFTLNTARSYLLYNLQSRLYSNFYCTGGAMQRASLSAASEMPDATPFIEQLSQANSGKGYIQEGWKVSALEGGFVAIASPNLMLWVPPEVCVAPQGGIVSGGTLALRLPKELPSISPGYYMAMGDQELKPEHFSRLVRLYWNITPAGAPGLIRHVTKRLNAGGIPFRLKVVSNPSGYSRRDTAALYIRKEDYVTLRSTLGDIYDALGEQARPGAPALTLPLAPGLSLAEDPGQGESFGLHRAMLVAEGLLRAYEAGAASVTERLRCVQDRFVESGLDPTRPYLQPDSADDYEPLPARHAGAATPIHTTQVPGDPSPQQDYRQHTKDDYLLVALQPGRLLSRQAVWHAGQCNWMGAMVAESSGSRSVGGYHALGPDLYDGTSGIALFLAELWSQVGDAELRRTALGAIAQALTRCEAQPQMDDMGLYTGWPGVALAAVRVGLLLREDEPVERARLLLRRFALPYEHEQREPDLLSGSAGAVVALLLLREALDDPLLLDYAAKLGDGLLRVAEKDHSGYSWRAARHKFRHNLTGFAHGAAGIGYALLQLYGATGEASYRVGAEQAFQYERHWFDPQEANWPDLRFHSAVSRPRKWQTESLSFASFWCHGAPGIALSRLRAYQLLGDESFRKEAICALQTTRKAARATLQAGITDFSLCHGLSGLAQILRHGRDIPGEESISTDIDSLVTHIADTGIAQYAGSDGGWPCGAGSGSPTPGLMLGYAGIGLFYLSLHTPSTFPVLFLSSSGKEDWVQPRIM